MSKTNCNIIKDLLPSYVDDLCTDESKEVIEEHLKECSECRELFKQMQETQLAANNEVHKEIDCLKKIKKYNLIKNILTGIFVSAILVCGIVIGIQSISHQVIPVIVYGCLAWAMTSIFFLLFKEYLGNKISDGVSKLSHCFTAISIIIYVYEIILIYLCTGANKLINLDASRIGPFVQTQLCIFVIIFLIFYITSFFVFFKKSEGMIAPSVLSATGMSYSLMLTGYLGKFETVDGFMKNFVIETAILLLVGIILLGIFYLAKRKEQSIKVISIILIAITLLGTVSGGIIWNKNIETSNKEILEEKIQLSNKEILEEGIQFYYLKNNTQADEENSVKNNYIVVSPCLTLDPVSQTFTFGYDALSSYYPYGTYKIDENKLTAITDDGLYHYVFIKQEDGTLTFCEKESSSVKLIDPRLGKQIIDGSVFSKEMIGICEKDKIVN